MYPADSRSDRVLFYVFTWALALTFLIFPSPFPWWVWVSCFLMFGPGATVMMLRVDAYYRRRRAQLFAEHAAWLRSRGRGSSIERVDRG